MFTDPRRFDAFEIDMMPELKDDMTVQQAVAHISIGILMRAYPNQVAGGPYCTPESIETYGPRLFTTVDNIYRDVRDSGKPFTIRVQWVEGRPELNIAKVGSIHTFLTN